MKKVIFLFASVVLIGTAQAQTKKNYLIKGEYLRGTVLKHNEHLKNLVKGPSEGIEFALEYRPAGEKDWHHFLNFPTVGFGLNYMNLGNPDTLGYATSIYPYLNIPIVRTAHFMLNVKAGGGLAYVNKTFKDTYNPNVDINFNNGAIGSRLNVFLAGGLNIEIPLFKGLNLTADYAWNHISNGSIVQPNSGINMLNAYIGLKVFPNFAVYTPPVRENRPDISRRITYEATLSGGIRELYYRDEGKKYPIASFSLAAYRPMSNRYRMGIGMDIFYDGVFGAVNSTDAGNTTDTEFKKTYITEKKSANLFRAGISWHHELILGRLTAGFHLGMYLYDPIKNLEPYHQAKEGNVRKGLIYSYNIDVEDGWFYTKAVAKYRITKHFFASVGLKTHLQKAEFIEWGFGYRL